MVCCECVRLGVDDWKGSVWGYNRLDDAEDRRRMSMLVGWRRC